MKYLAKIAWYRIIDVSEKIQPVLRHLNFLKDIIDEKLLKKINNFILSIQAQRIKYLVMSQRRSDLLTNNINHRKSQNYVMFLRVSLFDIWILMALTYLIKVKLNS